MTLIGNHALATPMHPKCPINGLTVPASMEYHRIMKSLLLPLSIHASIASSVLGGLTTFTETEFTDWHSYPYSGSPQQSVLIKTSGGNPNAYLEVATTTDEITYALNYGPSGQYHPGDGRIITIDYSIDIKSFHQVGRGQGFWLLAIQDGNIIYSGGYQDTGNTGEGWVTRTVSDLSWELGAPGFNQAGGSVVFGLWTGNSGGNGNLIGYDNFQVTLHTDSPTSPVPEPSTCLAGLGALGMLGAFGWRSRN